MKNFDAACYQDKRETYWFFKDKFCWFCTSDGTPVGPFLISNEFPKLPANIDAAVGVKDNDADSGNYWFFKGDKCYFKKGDTKDHEYDVEYKGLITSQFAGEKAKDLYDLDAACYQEDSKTYWFFKGDKYWSKAYGRNPVEGPFHIAPNSRFPNLVNSVNAATARGSRYWFFKGAECWSKENDSKAVVKDKGSIASNFGKFHDGNLFSWMKDIPNDTLLSCISIPGTHNTCTDKLEYNNIFKLIQKFAKCQSFDYRRQLALGVRFLDIRLKLIDGRLRAYHGPQDCFYTFDSILEGIQDFLVQNGSETILVSIHNEANGGEEAFATAVDKTINKENSWWYTENSIPTIKNVRGKAVLIRKYGGNSSLGIDWFTHRKNNSPRHDNGKAIIQDAYNPGNSKDSQSKKITMKRTYIKDLIQEAIKKHNDGSKMMYVNGSNMMTESLYDFKDNSVLTPKYYADKINPFLKETLEKDSKGYVGVIPMDFVVNSELTRLIIRRNFEK